ncbi:unnamed protein product [Adineta ricciae]|uniref:ALMS motif domain-containing protein n=1 Tax=Adineta ricciae TaxID=249248 RepID=A0A816BTY1_ADIRI|nr:unnamed protein product [Adineta ricciae]
MNENARTTRNTAQSPTSLSVEALEEIVRNCQRNEERLHELERHTRHERKKAERLLRETFQSKYNRDSRTTSAADCNTTDDNSHSNDYQEKQRSPKEFFVSLDDENDENGTYHHRHKRTFSQDKHLLARVEKLLAEDGTATSSDIVSSQERQKRFAERSISPVEDDLDEKLSEINEKRPHRHLPSACSIENELSTVDRLLSERTPVHNQRTKSDNHNNQEKLTKKLNTDNNEHIKDLADKRDQQFYKRLNNYVQTGRFISPESDQQMTVNIETSQYHSRPVNARINNKDEELSDLARRCEDLLTRLHAERNRAALLEKSTHRYDFHRRQPTLSSSSYESRRHSPHQRSISPTPLLQEEPSAMSLQQSLELLRPEFISRSRQRVRRVRLLREEREHNAEIDRERRQMLLFSCSSWCAKPHKRATSAPPTQRNVAFTVPYHQPDSSRIPLTYRQMKRATKKKYDQLPEVTDRRRQHQMEEVRRRNYLRAKVFRTRLRQHVARHGQTNIDESLTMIET